MNIKNLDHLVITTHTVVPDPITRLLFHFQLTAYPEAVKMLAERSES